MQNSIIFILGTTYNVQIKYYNPQQKSLNLLKIVVIMAVKVVLTKQENLYYVLAFIGSEEDPKYRTVFPYHTGGQENALEKAREFGKDAAKNLGVSLEENLFSA